MRMKLEGEYCREGCNFLICKTNTSKHRMNSSVHVPNNLLFAIEKKVVSSFFCDVISDLYGDIRTGARGWKMMFKAK